MLIAAGIPAEQVYVEGRGAESLAGLRVRPGDGVYTVNGLRALGHNRRTIMANLTRLHDLGAMVLDLETKDKSSTRGAEMLHRALSRIHGEEAISDRAHEMQQAQAAAKAERRLALTKAKKIWRDKSLSNKQALAKMWGWSQNTAYRIFNSRGLPTGRRK